MRTKRRIVAVTFIVLCALCPVNLLVFGDSLWSDQSVPLYSNKQRHFAIGDLITVQIMGQAPPPLPAVAVSAAPSAAPNATPSPSAAPSSSGNAPAPAPGGGNLPTTIVVQVKDIFPGGILAVEGKQAVKINNQDQVVMISGYIRSQDVQPDNTIVSTRIANAVIEYQRQDQEAVPEQTKRNTKAKTKTK